MVISSTKCSDGRTRGLADSKYSTNNDTVFALIDFTTGYHQTELDIYSRHLTAFIVMGDCTNGLASQWD